MESSPDDEAGLEAMKYRDLQKVAKEMGVKANLPKAQLVQKILELKSGGTAAPESAAASEERVAEPKGATPSKAASPRAAVASPRAKTTPKSDRRTPSKADPLRARLSSTPASIVKAKMKANKSLSTAEKLAKAVSEMTPDSVQLITPSPKKGTTPATKAAAASPRAAVASPVARAVTPRAKMTPKSVRTKTPTVGRATPSVGSAMKSARKTPFTASQKKKVRLALDPNLPQF